MSKGISLHIGLNQFDPAHYGSSGVLKGCENDAGDLEKIAGQQGFQTQCLLTTQATRDAVIIAVRRAAFELQKGDIFLLTYSGHGGRLPDRNRDEDDLLDETWCLYDGQLIDDELYVLWIGFKAGVRILVISDSCHSGTVLKPGEPLPQQPDTDAVPRFLPYQQAEEVYRRHRASYEALQPVHSDVRNREITASVRLLSGCQDNQYSYDGVNNGAFTAALKRSWDNGGFKGNYDRFHRHILAQMPSYQSPNHWMVGVKDPEYDGQKPFTI